MNRMGEELPAGPAFSFEQHRRVGLWRDLVEAEAPADLKEGELTELCDRFNEIEKMGKPGTAPAKKG